MSEGNSPAEVMRAHRRLFREIPVEVIEEWRVGKISLAKMLSNCEKERSVEEVLVEFKRYREMMELDNQAIAIPIAMRMREVVG